MTRSLPLPILTSFKHEARTPRASVGKTPGTRSHKLQLPSDGEGGGVGPRGAVECGIRPDARTAVAQAAVTRGAKPLPRSDRPFIRINCAAIPSTLIESELFGYRRGAFTGAHNDRRGLIEATAGGTLLLDEIAEMPV